MLATKTNRLIKYFSSCSREIHKSQSLVASDSKRRFQKWGIDPYRGLGGVKAPLHIVLSVTFFFFFSSTLLLSSFWTSHVVTSVAPSPPRPPRCSPSILCRAYLVGFSNPTARRFFHRGVLLTHALALSASQFVHKKSPYEFTQACTREGLELTKLTYTRLEDNLIRHRDDPYTCIR